MANIDDLLTKTMEARMGVNPYVSLGANVGGNIISAIVANQARRRAQERLSGLQRPSLPAFRQNPLLAQRIAQQQQLADQPMMGYQRAADEQAGRQMERGRQIAAGLGGGAGLAYMQGVSSNVAAQQRQGLLADMAMQARNRAELDQLINMRNQELQQQRNMEAMDYQLGMQDYIRQREGLEADIAQQQGNIGAAAGAVVADIPQYVQNFRMYNALRDATPRSTEPITPMTPIGVKQVPSVPQKTYYSELNDPMARYRMGLDPLRGYVPGVYVDSKGKPLKSPIRSEYRPPKQNYSPNLITDYYMNLPSFRESEFLPYNRFGPSAPFKR
jgi:soluble cytochrome b562